MWLLVLNKWDSPEQGSMVEAVIDIDDTGDYDGSRLEMTLPYASTRAFAFDQGGYSCFPNSQTPT